ncbi:MAG: PSD1 domain-containing protein [Planctomycetaceae bacterium]|nr:PSD1 domain-containing protein [Planctomycetaceae bacterium]
MKLLPLLLAITTPAILIAQDADAPVVADSQTLVFERDIRPILRTHCLECHGGTDELKGNLDMRLVRLMQAGGDSGPALVSGNAGESLIMQRIRAGEMPPGNHRVPEHDVAILDRWISSGAPTIRPEPESIGPGLGITPEDRAFWSFRPISPPVARPVSSFAPEQRVRTAMDAIVLQSLPEGLGFSPDADRETLIRRAYFDLIGLPPSPEELETWAKDSADDWYDRLLTDLLDSPHYGERWARHWLDVAGYADSEGSTNTDAERPWAWKYRDWVIRALNQDKPFDQFITEQLAGDELAGPQNGDLTAEQIELLTATGFLRMAADGTGSGAANADGRNQVMNDTLKIVGTSLLGVSLQCAQCHDHRYDPIPQEDYFAIRAVFEPALDWQAWKTPDARRVSLYTQADREKAAAIEAETTVVAEEKAAKQAAYMKQALDAELQKFEEPLRSQLREAWQTPGNERTEQHKQLLAMHPSVNITPGVLYQYIPESKPELEKFDARINEIRAKKPPEEFLRALVEPAGHVPETRLFFRGDHQQPKQVVAPAALTVTSPEGERVEFPLNDPDRPTTGRRLAFARWLTSTQNPLTARVIVNQVWMHHFGTGLVATPGDFGALGVHPTHPELLDWLAAELIRSGWSLKALHRLIMTSTVWRQAAEGHPDPSATETQLARRRLMRLDAETIRDRMLAAAGQLDRTLFGRPLPIREDDAGQVILDGAQTRRSMYVQWRRSRPVAMLQSFDAPVMQTNCEARSQSTVATQSLILMNGEFTLAQAENLANRVVHEARQQGPHTLDAETQAALLQVPAPAGSDWQYGFGDVDAAAGRVADFTRLEHFDGSRWQAGPELPDPQLGYVLLNATGGHPDTKGRAVIRRWTTPITGTVTVSGSLSHGSPNGDGVRGRIVSSRSGVIGEWVAFNGAVETKTEAVSVQTGDTIDFVTDCREHHTSDSFNWPVTLAATSADGKTQQIVSTSAFRGPAEDPADLPGQIIRAWKLALCRDPSAEELLLAVRFSADQVRALQESGVKLPEGRSVHRQVLMNLCQSLLSCNEFLYVD